MLTFSHIWLLTPNKKWISIFISLLIICVNHDIFYETYHIKKLVKWRREKDWNIPRCKRSAEWNYIPDDEKANLGINFEEDGEFWMSYRDFIKYFDQVIRRKGISSNGQGQGLAVTGEGVGAVLNLITLSKYSLEKTELVWILQQILDEDSLDSGLAFDIAV